MSHSLLDIQLNGQHSLGHNFFDPQPVRNADVFLMRYIIHDWSDKYASTILDRLREAATPTTKLYVIDKIIPYLCPPSAASDELSSGRAVSGILKPDLPYPITNQSAGISHPHISSINVRFCNCSINSNLYASSVLCR